MKNILTVVPIGVLILSLLVISAQHAGALFKTLVFSTIGDDGANNEYKSAVASMVTRWNPNLIIGLGDDYYAEAGGIESEKYHLSTAYLNCNYSGTKIILWAAIIFTILSETNLCRWIGWQGREIIF